MNDKSSREYSLTFAELDVAEVIDKHKYEEAMSLLNDINTTMNKATL